MELLHRPRRLRTSEAVREMARETRLSKKALVYPVFIREGSGIREEIPSLPGQYHYSPDTICEEMERLVKAGINKILLFGIPAHKDEMGSSAWDDNGAVQQAIREIKKNFPQIYCITDVCMCEYTSHGHCGVLDTCTTVNNDKTLELLCKVSLSHVRAGADMVAPSDMMDGRVLAIRHALDSEGFTHIPIWQASQRTNLPLAAYSVSGEYAMIESAAKADLIDRDRIIGEVAVSIFRAGADILITYHAKDIARLIDEGKIG